MPAKRDSGTSRSKPVIRPLPGVFPLPTGRRNGQHCTRQSGRLAVRRPQLHRQAVYPGMEQRQRGRYGCRNFGGGRGRSIFVCQLGQTYSGRACRNQRLPGFDGPRLFRRPDKIQAEYSVRLQSPDQAGRRNYVPYRIRRRHQRSAFRSSGGNGRSI